MAEAKKQGIEKILQGTVVVLCVSIVAVMAFLVKDVFFARKLSAPRTSIEKQLADAERVIKNNPEDVKGYLMLGITYSEMGKYKEAEEQYSNAIKIDKGYPRTYYLMSLNYEKAGKITKAIDILKKVKNDEQSLFQLGRLYTVQKDYKKAIETLKKALSKRETASDTLYYLGLAYEKQGNKKEAAGYYQKALKFAPDFELASNALKRVK